jgi:hypothetical protein
MLTMAWASDEELRPRAANPSFRLTEVMWPADPSVGFTSGCCRRAAWTGLFDGSVGLVGHAAADGDRPGDAEQDDERETEDKWRRPATAAMAQVRASGW